MRIAAVALVGMAVVVGCGGGSPEVSTAPITGGQTSTSQRASSACSATRVEGDVVRAGPFRGHISPGYDALDGRFRLRVGELRDAATGLTQKIPWFVEPGARVGESLMITGKRLSPSTGTFRQTLGRTESATGETVFPSVIAPRAEGCWRLRLTSGETTGSLTVLVVEGGASVAADDAVGKARGTDRGDLAAITTTFDVPVAQPVSLAAAGPAMFVAGRGSATDRESPEIVRMSVKRLRPLAEPTSIGSRPGRVAVIQGEAVLWVVHGASRTLRTMDPGSGRPIGAISGLSEPVAVAVGHGSVWVADRGPGERADRRGFVRRAVATDDRFSVTIPVGRAPAGITTTRSGVWVTNSGDDTVTRVDPSTNRPSEEIRVGDRPSAITGTPGAVWVVNSGDGTVSRIDARENRVVATVRVGRAPRGIADGGGSVWVTNELDDRVTRISQRTNRVTAKVAVGRRPTGIVFRHRAAWVANRLGRSVTRIRP